jgi:transposase
MVVLGVDPHKQTYTVVAVDQTGRQLAQLTVSARTDGQLRLLGWARQLPLGEGGERRWAVEDGRQVAGRLVAQLLRAGEAVVWVPPKLMANARTSARTRGKSDPIDAGGGQGGAAGARACPAQLQGPALAVRLVADHREHLVAERTRMINRLRWHLHDLDPELAPPTATLTRLWVLERLAGQLQGLAGVRAEIAAELVARIRQLTERINQLEADLDRLVKPLAGHLRQVVGVGALGAAKLIGETGGVCAWPQRPVRHARRRGPDPVWSGNRTRHRLNRGGNQQLNAAIHLVAVTQLRAHPPARALMARRIAAGNSKPEALRVLKRHLAYALYGCYVLRRTGGQHRHGRTTSHHLT